MMVYPSGRKVFLRCITKNLIYRGEYISIGIKSKNGFNSDIEVIHKDVEGAFYSYDLIAISNGSGSVEMPQPRPETNAA